VVKLFNKKITLWWTCMFKYAMSCYVVLHHAMSCGAYIHTAGSAQNASQKFSEHTVF